MEAIIRDQPKLWSRVFGHKKNQIPPKEEKLQTWKFFHPYSVEERVDAIGLGKQMKNSLSMDKINLKFKTW